jgi:hypothetical protein
MELKLQEIVEQKSIEEATNQFERLRVLTEKDPYLYEQQKEYKEIQSYVLSSDPQEQVSFILKSIDEVSCLRKILGKPETNKFSYMNLRHENGFPRAAVNIVCLLFRRKLYFSEQQLLFMINRTSYLK